MGADDGAAGGNENNEQKVISSEGEDWAGGRETEAMLALSDQMK